MATKKITELPLITRISGSQEYGGSVLPVVVGGTTNQISAENFSRFVNAYDAQTGSQNIFTQNQWFNTIVSASTINVGTLGVGGNTTIAGTLGVGGNGTIGGNLAVAGRITAEEFYTEITTASVIYASGSTKFGDDTGDTHEFTGSINVSGSVIYNGVILTNIDANTIQKLQQTTQSLQVATASLNTFTASQDGRNFTLSQITASFAGEIGGLEEYTASLKTAAIVSSSTQIQNYNLFAVTSSDNTFYGTQRITGSLSVSRGQFNVVTASGGLTSSLTFTHNITSPGDGNAILELRHNNRIYNDDIAIKLKADFAGAYLDYEENTVPYSILSVQSFANKNLYIHQDTRLLFSNLTVDDFLTVQKGVVIGSGSLLVNGVITGSILATNGVISSSNQLFELNQFTASQDSRNFTLSQVTGSLIGITNGLMAFTAALDNTYATDAQLFQLYQATRSIELTTGSLIGITNGLMAFTAALDNTYATDAQLYQLYQSTRSLELHSGSMVGVTNGLMAYTASNTSLNSGLRGEVDGIEAYTASLKGQAIVSSSTQVQNYDVFALNSNLYTSTGSLIGITNGLMAFTAALDSTYATDAQLFQLYQATRSIELTTGSLIGITNGLMAFTASLDNTFATDIQLLPILQATRSLELLSGSLIGITNGLMAFTAALDSTYATDAQLYQLYAETASIKAEIGGIEAYTASLKGAAIVSSSQQITNYYKFAETASANTFYGNQTITGSVNVKGSLDLTITSYVPTGSGHNATLIIEEKEAWTQGIAISQWSAGVYNASYPSGFIGIANTGAAVSISGGARIVNNPAALNWAKTTNVTSAGFIVIGGDTIIYTNGSLTANTLYTPTERVRATSDGYLRLATKGIQFNGDTADANSLDDYEEGTWTPALTTSGGTPPTLVSSSGRYIIVGKLVTIYFKFLLSSASGGSGQLKITNAPLVLNTATIPAVGFARILDTGTTLNCGFLTGTVINFNKYDGGYAGVDYEVVGQVSYYND
jgi:hypothetical protein